MTYVVNRVGDLSEVDLVPEASSDSAEPSDELRALLTPVGDLDRVDRQRGISEVTERQRTSSNSHPNWEAGNRQLPARTTGARLTGLTSL